jgi:RimJ/RimL family protein N-acetyltransferase
VIRLRVQSDADVAGLVAACQDPEIARWTLLPSPYTREDARKWIALAEGQRRRGTAYHQLIVGADDDRLLGAIGVELRSEDGRIYGDLGYWLAADARGHGHATAALRLLTDWALESLGLEWLQIVIDPRNAPSRRVAERAGYRLAERGPTTFRGEVVQFDRYELEPPEPSPA